LTWLGDGLANVTKVVGERLELSAVVDDGEITLVEVVKLGFIEDDTLQLIVVVEGMDGHLEGEGTSLLLGLADDAQHLR
jgi:hypothetical protein